MSESISISLGRGLEEMIELAFRAGIAVLLEGDTGVGKSELIQELARQMGVEFVALDLALLDPTDLLGMPFIEGHVTRYAPPDILPQKGRGILLLEELNRADSLVQAPALQLLTARRLHNYQLPEGWIVMAAVNPQGGDYIVNRLDPAMRARFLNLRVVPDVACWLDWAMTNAIHPAVLRLAAAHDAIFADVPPRTWTYVSRLLCAMSETQQRDTAFAQRMLSGYLPLPWIKLLLEQTSRLDEEARIDARQLLLPLRHARRAREALASALENGRTDCVDRVYAELFRIVSGPTLAELAELEAFHLTAFEKTLDAMPGDLRENLQAGFGRNPLAAGVLGVDPERVLTSYTGSLRNRIKTWARRPDLRHRLDALATALQLHLEESDAMAQVAADERRQRYLARFIGDVSRTQATPLLRLVMRADIDIMRFS